MAPPYGFLISKKTKTIGVKKGSGKDEG